MYLDPKLDPMWHREQDEKDRAALVVFVVIVTALALIIGGCALFA